MRKILIYGAGKKFKEWFMDGTLQQWLDRNGYEVIGVADKNPDLRGGSMVCGGETQYPIGSFNSYGADTYDLIAVTSDKFFEEIRAELVGMGVPDERIKTVGGLIEESIWGGEYQYGLSLTVIIKNEGDYIEEWINFHRCVGVEHFYIYDNDSTDGTKELLQKYVDMGIVTYTAWSGKAMQLPVYNDAIDKYRYETKYMGFIDADEFLFPAEESSLQEVIETIVLQHRKACVPIVEKRAAGVGVNWRIYGTSGHKEKKNGLVIERFLYSEAGSNIHIKSVCNPRALVGINNPHYGSYVSGFCCISENGSEIPGPFFRDGACGKLRINHYVSKSEEEFIQRKSNGNASSKKGYTDKQILKSLEIWKTECNEFYDPIALRYMERVKKMMK